VRGGTSRTRSRFPFPLGLSPRARGNLWTLYPSRSALRPIPACAGEPGHRSSLIFRSRAYPRVRGGTIVTLVEKLKSEGLSPRARGNLPLVTSQTWGVRPIPACAGEPPRPPGHACLPSAYPRVRGGTQLYEIDGSQSTGLSPRARGNRPAKRNFDNAIGPIPACAGEPW